MQRQIEGKAKTAATISLTECLQMMQQQGYTPEEAMMMCNSNIVSSNNNNKTGAIDNRLYVKAFLVDTTLNINSFRVPEEVIKRDVYTYIGKPLVMQEDFDHPMPPADHPDSLQHWLAYQESFRVGTIIDVVSKPNATTGGTIYYAIIEVTDPNLKQALRDNSVPIYVSPAMGERASKSKHDGVINEFTGVHLAIVDKPAYGIKKAVITDQCGGDQDTCLLRLRKAHIEKHGQNGGCGFCVKKALEKYKIIVKSASIGRKNGNPVLANNTNTSHTFRDEKSSRGNYKSNLSVLEPTTDSNNNNTSGNNSNESLQSNQSSKNDFTNNNNNNNSGFIEREKPQITTTYKQPINTPNFQKEIANAPIAELYAKIQQLEMENRILKESNNEAKSSNDTLLERVAGLEKINRRIAIERLITPDLFKNEKERLERIDYYTNHSPATLEELEKTFSDMRVFARKASVNQRTSARVPYYTGTSLGSSGVATSANTTQNSGFSSLSEEGSETMTPLQKQLAVLRGGH